MSQNPRKCLVIFSTNPDRHLLQKEAVNVFTQRVTGDVEDNWLAQKSHRHADKGLEGFFNDIVLHNSKFLLHSCLYALKQNESFQEVEQWKLKPVQ